MTIERQNEIQECINNNENSEEDTAIEATQEFEDNFVDHEMDKPILPLNDEGEEESSSRISCWRQNSQFLSGIALAFLSGLIFTVNSYVIQTMALDFSQTLLVRSLIFLIIFSILCYVRKLSPWPSLEQVSLKAKIFMVIQGVLGAIMIMTAFCCLSFLPLGDALTLMFTSPLSTMIMAAIFLGHRLRLFKIFFGLFLMSGTVLVIQPEFLFSVTSESWRPLLKNLLTVPIQDVQVHDKYYFIGVAIALSSALADGCLNVAINFCQQINSLVLLWWTGLGGLIVSLVSFSFNPNAVMLGPNIALITKWEWLSYFLTSFSGLVAYFFMTKSLQMIDPTVVAFVRSFEIVLAYIVQIGIIGDLPNTLSLIGAGMVLVSVTAMSLQKQLISLLPSRLQRLC